MAGARTPTRGRVVSVASWILLAVIGWLLWPTSLGGCTSLVIVNGESMLPTLHAGDLAIARCGQAKVGDIVVYKPFEGNPVTIIHRLVGGDGKTDWVARGDNNTFDDPFDFTDKNVVGVMVAYIPKAGFFLAFLTAPLLWLTLTLGAITFWLWPVRKKVPPTGDDGTGEETTPGEEGSDETAESTEHAAA